MRRGDAFEAVCRRAPGFQKVAAPYTTRDTLRYGFAGLAGAVVIEAAPDLFREQQ